MPLPQFWKLVTCGKVAFVSNNLLNLISCVYALQIRLSVSQLYRVSMWIFEVFLEENMTVRLGFTPKCQIERSSTSQKTGHPLFWVSVPLFFWCLYDI